MRNNVALLSVWLCLLGGGVVEASTGWGDCRGSFAGLVPPAQPNGSVPICRASTIAISYDPSMINPIFSAYYLQPKLERNLLTGRDTFYEDPDLKRLGIREPSTKSRAFNSSWNKGHLAPSHALSWSKDTKKATYTMANVAPQAARFNQSPWRRLEASIVNWITSNNKSAYVITGVGYKNLKRPRRTYDGVSVPDYYWTALCNSRDKKSAAWVGYNEAEKRAVMQPMAVTAFQSNFYGYPSNLNLFSDRDCNIRNLDTRYWAGIEGPLEDTETAYLKKPPGGLPLEL